MAKLKVGDVVGVDMFVPGGGTCYRRETVKKLTAASVFLSDSWSFARSTGKVRGGSHFGHDRLELIEYTDKVKQRVIFQNALALCERTRWSELPEEVVLQVARVVLCSLADHKKASKDPK